MNDEFDAIRPFAADAIRFDLTGPAELIGDNTFGLVARTGAIWIPWSSQNLSKLRRSVLVGASRRWSLKRAVEIIQGCGGRRTANKGRPRLRSRGLNLRGASKLGKP
jgi:hypothetical protein